MKFGWNRQNGLGSCAGAEVHIKADGTFDIRLLKLSLQKKLIQIDSKKQFNGDLDKIIPESIGEPLALTITGRGVLIKKTAKLENVTEQNLQHLFPNLKIAEFYVQHFASGEHSFIAIIRREITDAILAAFRKQGAEIMMLSLGPFVVGQVIAQVNIYDGNLNFDGHQIQLNEEKVWQDYRYLANAEAEFTLKIDIEIIAQQFLLAYATAFQLILNENLDLIEVESTALREGLAELSAKLKFKRNGTTALLLFFGLLMLNFLVFSFYNSRNQELAGMAGQQSNLSVNREKLEADVKEKEFMVEKLGWNKGLSYAYLCDQIGQTVPATVILTELSVNSPSNTGTGLAKESTPEPFCIRIRGQAKNVYVINDWMYDLKHRPWVKKVRLEKYATDDQKETQVFTILLNY